ncbi:hypothetical protein EVAR_47361_1 [Eumeta japonica]|uniref:Uncharacterized protein n=1 Tax=Eumeta variegata TaxID=151549 RepID=A0A4C1WUE0_EUMVA|nr:hypothetical protein EVAR_47361_1 [Eumeta japonica]
MLIASKSICLELERSRRLNAAAVTGIDSVQPSQKYLASCCCCYGIRVGQPANSDPRHGVGAGAGARSPESSQVTSRTLSLFLDIFIWSAESSGAGRPAPARSNFIFDVSRPLHSTFAPCRRC